MNKPSFEDIRKVLHELILPFYQLERDLSLPIQNHRNETDAEHSWSLSLLTLALAPQIDPDLDVNKACAIAIIHDLVEVYAGDTSVWAPLKDHESKPKREKAALKKITQHFVNFPNIANTIGEYENKNSNEARFVHALDKFLALLMLYEDKGYYYLRDKITQERFNQQFEPHRKKAQSHDGVYEYYKQLREKFESHPEYFYQDK